MTAKHLDFQRTLETARGEPLLILISGHPDPDAIGSALAHQHICEALEIPATIAHVMPVSRPENRALVKLLNVNMIQVATTKDLEPYKHLSLVDTSSPESSIKLPDELKVLTVVDHHRSTKPVEAEFVDVRTGFGATCSIYAEYLKAGLAPLTGSEREQVHMATALLFGIRTDTDDFARAEPADFHAAAYLKPYCDLQLLQRIGQKVIAAESMEALARGLGDMDVVRDFALVGVGRVSPSNRDAIATAADFIVRREDLDTVIVYGLVGNRIDGSMRTNSPSVDPTHFLEEAFGKDANGQPYGGGRADKGGFQIPLGILCEADDDDSLWRLVRQTVRRRIGTVIPELLGDTNGRS
ncbi:MAG: bifunctional oligoribonuclease/PAP phosphatase NrnA [Polyangiaceae bacterium]|nr:bifunctional oligoribonuclease/PAP phosphatase NrnA [Myxococcales bacterium]MCB9584639.1 bifunctional oligoribonuclease/PAP phosphatase NrnA [Polyangiaceae bacterium]MCB9609076.1 bifunctional oligoribonuclease/PAP phosphatase NrnA [Polyangiaceae bacterium]